MRAIVCKEFGPPEKLVLEEVDDSDRRSRASS